MPLFRQLSRRDAVLVMLGAACMHIFSTAFPFTVSDASSIVINTHYSTPDLEPLPPPPEPDPIKRIPNVNQAVPPINQPTTDPEPVPTPLPIELSPTLPETTILSHAPGWTIFQNLYMSEGTLYILSPHRPSYFPDIRYMTSTGLPAENTPENIALREPTRQNMDFITPEEARRRWGGDVALGEPNRVWSVEGNTLLYNDPSQFLRHYYHLVAELILGTWAFWSGTFSQSSHSLQSQSQSPAFTSHTTPPTPNSTLPPIHRAIFAHSNADGWRDSPGFNAYFLRAAFPSLTVEVQEDWADRIAATTPPKQAFTPSRLGLNTNPNQPPNANININGPQIPITGERAWHFPLLLLADRSASFRGEACGSRTQRTAAEAWEHMVSSASLKRGWWEPIRLAVTRFAGAPSLVPSIQSDAQVVLGTGKERDEDLPIPEKVVITYISRQGSRRRLVEGDHHVLVEALEEMVRRRGEGWELNVIQAERLSKDEQVRAVAKATILLGVHGNGLTHLVLMPPTRISTVIEMFYPGGFAHDYEWTTRALGMRHFAVWNDTYHTYPNTPNVDYPEGFQGSSIPVYGPTVAKIIEDRVDGKL